VLSRRTPFILGLAHAHYLRNAAPLKKQGSHAAPRRVTVVEVLR
jgi:hypothetical protein